MDTGLNPGNGGEGKKRSCVCRYSGEKAKRGRSCVSVFGGEGKKRSCAAAPPIVVVLPPALTVWPGATSVKIDNLIKKKLETVSLSHSTPVKLEERESALLAAAFRALSSSSWRRRGIV
jgi:hypothetical protein